MPRENMADLAASVVGALRSYHGHATDLDQQLATRAGLSPSDMRCLDLLDLHDGRMSAGDLARAANLTTGAITGVIDRLGRAGLVHRVADPADRRRVIVELDPDGHEKGRRSYASIVDAERDHLNGLSRRELEGLRDFLAAEASWVQARVAQLQSGNEPPAVTR